MRGVSFPYVDALDGELRSVRTTGILHLSVSGKACKEDFYKCLPRIKCEIYHWNCFSGVESENSLSSRYGLHGCHRVRGAVDQVSKHRTR